MNKQTLFISALTLLNSSLSEPANCPEIGKMLSVEVVLHGPDVDGDFLAELEENNEKEE